MTLSQTSPARACVQARCMPCCVLTSADLRGSVRTSACTMGHSGTCFLIPFGRHTVLRSISLISRVHSKRWSTFPLVHINNTQPTCHTGPSRSGSVKLSPKRGTLAIK